MISASSTRVAVSRQHPARAHRAQQLGASPVVHAIRTSVAAPQSGQMNESHFGASGIEGVSSTNHQLTWEAYAEHAYIEPSKRASYAHLSVARPRTLAVSRVMTTPTS
jgi:hypothetical protein